MLRWVSLCFALALFGCGGNSSEEEVEPVDVTSGDEMPTAENEDPEQTYAEALDVICNQWVGLAEIENAEPSIRAMRLAEWISERLTNPQAIEMFDNIATVSPEDRANILRIQAQEQGLDRCAIVEIWTPEAEPVELPQ